MSKTTQNQPESIPSGIFEASLGPNGDVVRVKKLTLKEAVELRKNGYNVVVCGPDFKMNRTRAEMIETSALGMAVHHAPSATAGAHALYHFQPNPRGQKKGHTFYESPGRSSQP